MVDSVRYNPPGAAVASAARTTTGNSAPDGGPDGAAQLAVAVNVTAVSGTPNLVIGVQWSMDGVNFYNGDPADAMTAITATGLVAKSFTRKGPFHRITWAITGGTPSLTFDVKTWLFG